VRTGKKYASKCAQEASGEKQNACEPGALRPQTFSSGEKCKKLKNMQQANSEQATKNDNWEILQNNCGGKIKAVMRQ
jgi:hypothetical protein